MKRRETDTTNMMTRCARWLIAVLAVFLCLEQAAGGSVIGGAYPYRYPSADLMVRNQARTVVGSIRNHLVQNKETFLDIARRYDLGYNELRSLYPNMDPWVPPAGTKLLIPTRWVLPERKKAEIVINLAEHRLYYFIPAIRLVKTYPVGIGSAEWPSPVGEFTIDEKAESPTWFIPASLEEKYDAKKIPPGPENPLGKFWLGLGGSDGYGIHGTNFPWSIGRSISHGCIRLYPEDIRNFYPFVNKGTRVRIVYEPVKFGVRLGRVYVEAHADIYNRIENIYEYAYDRMRRMRLSRRIDLVRLRRALKEKTGVPVNITRNR